MGPKEEYKERGVNIVNEEKQQGMNIKMGPAAKRIFQWNKDILLRNYVLVQNRLSDLSAKQRKLTIYRVEYGLEHGTITEGDILLIVNELDAHIESALKEEE